MACKDNNRTKMLENNSMENEISYSVLFCLVLFLSQSNPSLLLSSSILIGHNSLINTCQPIFQKMFSLKIIFCVLLLYWIFKIMLSY